MNLITLSWHKMMLATSLCSIIFVFNQHAFTSADFRGPRLQQLAACHCRVLRRAACRAIASNANFVL